MITETKHLRFTAVVPCDDVRQEANGKEILIGVYKGTMVFETYPAVSGVVYWITADLQEDAKNTVFNVAFRVTKTGDEILLESPSFKIEPQDDDERRGLTIGFGVGPVEFTQSTDLWLEVRDDGGDWERLNLLKVRLRAEVPPPKIVGVAKM